MQILDGKVVAADLKQRLKEEIDLAVASGQRPPMLVIYTVGDDPASKVYVRNKIKTCNELGIMVEHFQAPNDITTEQLIQLIQNDNEIAEIDGIMVQLPLPAHLDERAIIDAISPKKDVDGLTTESIGRLRSGQPGFKPCTAKGIIDLCKYYNILLNGQDVTIIGRSNIVGKPLADMMMAEGATVTQCHSHTKNLEWHIQYANVIISAVGKPKFLGSTSLGVHQTFIDVGINRDENGKLCGDIDFDLVKDYASAITPVPGGVGPMTVAELMANTVEAWRENV